MGPIFRRKYRSGWKLIQSAIVAIDCNDLHSSRSAGGDWSIMDLLSHRETFLPRPARPDAAAVIPPSSQPDFGWGVNVRRL